MLEDFTLTKTERRKFYDGLRKTRSVFQWKLTRDGKLRAVLNGSYYCPLTAIAKVETGKRIPSGRADEAKSPTLDKLTEYGKYDIMNAADSDSFLDEEEVVVRRTMLRIVGLNS
jgi:hypothetical protein